MNDAYPMIRLGMAANLGKYLNSSLILNTHVTDKMIPGYTLAYCRISSTTGIANRGASRR